MKNLVGITQEALRVARFRSGLNAEERDAFNHIVGAIEHDRIQGGASEPQQATVGKAHRVMPMHVRKRLSVLAKARWAKIRRGKA